MNSSVAQKKRLNFIVEAFVAEELKEVIPSGERSGFVSQAIQKALVQFSREKAYKETKELRKKLNLKIGNNEKLYKIIRSGRG